MFTLRKFTVASLILVLFVSACARSGSKIPFSDLPARGSADHGRDIFSSGANGAEACSTCHRLDDTNGVGPGLGGLAARAGTRIEGQSAREYVFNSIADPGKFIAPGFTNQMYAQYSEKLTAQDIADVIEFLLSQPQK